MAAYRARSPGSAEDAYEKRLRGLCNPLRVVPHLIVCRACSCSRSARLSFLTIARLPPFQAFRETTAFPSAVLGPVALSQGRHR